MLQLPDTLFCQQTSFWKKNLVINLADHILHVDTQFPEGANKYFQADGLSGSPSGGDSWGARGH